MKRFISRVTCWVIPAITLLSLSIKTQAQTASAEMIKAGSYNANKYVQAYFQPGGDAFGHALNSGWFNTAKTMGLGRFDVRIYGSAGISSNDQRTFDLAKVGFDTHVRLDPDNTIAPTVFGIDEEGAPITVLDEDGDVIGSFNAPEGSGVVVAPAPIAQVNVGLIKGTELAVRFIPTVHVDDYKGKLWGVGIKHDLKQWVPGLNLIPGFDIAAVGGYTTFETQAKINVRPDETASRTAQQQQPGYYGNQLLLLDIRSWMAGVVVSKTISILTGYAGAKYSKSTTKIHLNGNYPLTSVSHIGPISQRYIEDIVDPVAVDMSHGQYSVNAGLKLKLGFFSLFGEYSVGKYSTASAGIGLGFN